MTSGAFSLGYLGRRAALIAAQLLSVVVVLLVWQSLSDHNVINPSFFSKPSSIWSYLRGWGSSDNGPGSAETLWQDLWATVVVFLLGYLLGSGIGILIGVVMGSFSFVREVLGPYIAFFNAVPRLILLPLLVVIFGFGQFPQVLLVVLVIVFLVIVNVTDGIDEVRGDLIANSRILGANRYHLIRDVYAPSLAIRLISTGRVTIGYAIQATVAAELIGASRGLGFRITDGQSKDAAQEIFAAFAVLMVLALVVDVLLSVAERRATRWMPS